MRKLVVTFAAAVAALSLAAPALADAYGKPAPNPMKSSGLLPNPFKDTGVAPNPWKSTGVRMLPLIQVKADRG